MKTDFSNCKHIEIRKLSPDEDHRVGDLLASIEGNSFGDQIIHFRAYHSSFDKERKMTVFCFETYATETAHEGSWLNEAQIKKLAKQLYKIR